MYKFHIGRNPLGLDKNMYAKANIEFEPGITVLVGCNGAGKTSMIRGIKSNLRENNEKYIYYSDIESGRSNALSEALFHNNMNFLATSTISSEGERIGLNIANKIFYELGEFIRNKSADVNKFFVIVDGLDSGTSIDVIIEINTIFREIIEDYKKNEVDLYIIVTANSYETTVGNRCLDVMSSKYIEFSSYEDYKKFILNTRKKKDKRDE